jgi:dihydrofolate reductase
MIISMIAAMTESGVIGNNGVLPWSIPDEMLYFKRKTIGHPVIMGANTFLSLKKPLVQRKNIVITKKRMKELQKIGGITVVDSIAAAVDCCDGETAECFIIGGSTVYKQALDLDIVDRMYLNFIDGDYPGDAKFPEFDQQDWTTEKVKEEYDEFIPTIWYRKKTIYAPTV